mgnify:CR=1 FL=1
MKTLLATIIAASLTVGCGMIEGEQTTADTSGGGSSTPTDTGGGSNSGGSEETSSLTCAVDSLVELGRDGQVTISQNGKYVLQGLEGQLKRYNTVTGEYDYFPLENSRPYGNYQPQGITDDGNTVYIGTWNGYNLETLTTEMMTGFGGRLYSLDLTTGQAQPLDVDESGNNLSYYTWRSGMGGDQSSIDHTPDGKYVVFSLNDRIDPNDWNAGQETHIYRKNTQTGEVTKVDTTTDEFEVGYSRSPKISKDGRYVVFQTNINLLNDPNHTGTSDYNLFRTDLETGAIIWVSGSNNNGLTADISGDGRVIAMHTGSYTVSLWQDGLVSAPLSNSLYPHISPDGAYVAMMNTNGYSQRTYNIDESQFSSIPNIPYHTEGHFSSESIVAIGNGGLLLWTWHDYKDTDTDGDADYYFYEYSCVGNDGSVDVDSSTELIWSGTQQLGASGIDSGKDITTDSDGNIYVTGTTSGNLDNNTSSGGKDIFVTKYDSSGSKKWTQQLGSSSDDEGLGITTDNAGNIYVTGITNGSLENNTTAGVADLFVAKYSSQGNKQWIRQLGSPSHDSGNAIATDSNGNIFITGVTYGAFDGNTNAGPFTGSYDLFIVKYDGDGTKKWTRQLGTYGSDYGQDIEVDSAGNAYVTGYTNGGLDGNTSAGNYDLFIVKYDNDGTKKWTRQLGSSSDDHGQGIGVDNSGNVYVTGKTLWQLPNQVAAGGYDVFIAKYSDNGTKQWTRQFGTSEIDDGTDLALDVTGNVYVTGFTRGNLDDVSNNGADDFFVTKYSDNGTKQWSKLLGTTAGEQGNGISVDAAGNSYVTGFTSTGFDGNSSFGSDDVFVTKLDTNGNKK